MRSVISLIALGLFAASTSALAYPADAAVAAPADAATVAGVANDRYEREREWERRERERHRNDRGWERDHPRGRHYRRDVAATDAAADAAGNERERHERERERARELEWERERERHRGDRAWERDHPRPHWRRDVEAAEAVEAAAGYDGDRRHDRDGHDGRRDWDRNHRGYRHY